MTEFEFGELFAFASQDAFSQFVSISTMLFAYLLAAHFVFRTLTRPLAAGATVIFVMFYGTTLTGYLGAFLRLAEISTRYYAAYPNGWVVPRMTDANITVLVTAIPVLLALIGSIYYAHFHVRKTT